MGEFNSDDHYIYYCEQESLIRNGVALIVNKRVQNAVFGYSLTNDRMISVCFQGKAFNITVIQVYTPTGNAQEAEVEWFCSRPSIDLQDLLELTPQKRCPFHYRGLECKRHWTSGNKGHCSLRNRKQSEPSNCPALPRGLEKVSRLPCMERDPCRGQCIAVTQGQAVLLQ